jgi:hypothetical protein
LQRVGRFYLMVDAMSWILAAGSKHMCGCRMRLA